MQNIQGPGRWSADAALSQPRSDRTPGHRDLRGLPRLGPEPEENREGPGAAAESRCYNPKEAGECIIKDDAAGVTKA